MHLYIFCIFRCTELCEQTPLIHSRSTQDYFIYRYLSGRRAAVIVVVVDTIGGNVYKLIQLYCFIHLNSIGTRLHFE